MNPTWHAVCLRPTQWRLTFVIVKLSLTAVHRKVIQRVISEVFMHLHPWKISVGKIFCKVSVVTKITKIFNYENLALYSNHEVHMSL